MILDAFKRAVNNLLDKIGPKLFVAALVELKKNLEENPYGR